MVHGDVKAVRGGHSKGKLVIELATEFLARLGDRGIECALVQESIRAA